MNARILPPEEWGRLPALTGMPNFSPIMNPPDTEVIVVERDGEIVASMAVMRMTHFEAAWVHPSVKGNAGVVRRLLNASFDSARRFPERFAVAMCNERAVSDLLVRLGGSRMPVDSYAVPVGEKTL